MNVHAIDTQSPVNTFHPIIIFWQIGKKGEVEQVVKDAIDIGYRHIDGAMIYENEKQVGAGINAKIAEGVIKREDIFVTSKVSWPAAAHISSDHPRL